MNATDMAAEKSHDETERHVTPYDQAVLNRIFNPNLPYGDTVDEETDCPVTVEEDKEVIEEVKQLGMEGVKLAETGDLQSALNKFGQAINLAPDHASCYNNRAQVLRLTKDNTGAMEDLNKAIELSQGHGNTACQAYTQRGLIRRLEGQDAEALDDFKHAANLGGQFAKQLVVTLNPYAALCNQMLAEVMQKIRSGETEISN